ncbi:DUF1330 domain-containing protein [Coralliovum pocilloporae]|uniref:DUF1330 domain-containing protein n=1 Tax=Coralliovum pocilloporae TaxID=3066369 RepID=UPI003306D7E1
MDQDAYIDPERAAWEAFKALPRDHDIHMLNLVRFRDKACYPDDHPNADKDMSGAEAYQLYGATSASVLKDIGGSVIWSGAMQTMVIGPETEQWDAVFIAHYPNASAFMAMVKHPVYSEAVVHRQAAVLTSRLIRCLPKGGGETFG